MIVALLVGTGVTVLAGLVAGPPRDPRAAAGGAARGGRAADRRASAAGSSSCGVLTRRRRVAPALGLFGGEGAGQVLALLARRRDPGLRRRRAAQPAARAADRPRGRMANRAAARRRRAGSRARTRMRNPSRTAVTAAALMIGLALVTFVSILAAGVKASIDDTIGNDMQATSS